MVHELCDCNMAGAGCPALTTELDVSLREYGGNGDGNEEEVADGSKEVLMFGTALLRDVETRAAC